MSTELAPSASPGNTSSVELEQVTTPATNDLDHKRPEPEAEPKKPESRREAIERAKADLEAKEAKEPKPEVKTEPKVEAKQPEAKTDPKNPAEKSDGVERAAQEADKPKPSEGKGNDAPARFLPKAKELWVNTPNPVKDEVHRAIREHEEAAKQYEVSHREWSELKSYDQMAKANGTTVKEALDRYTSVDRLLRTEPVKGIEQVLQIAGVTPQQYANFVMSQNGQQQSAQPGQPQQPARDPQIVNAVTHQSQQITTLMQKLEQLQHEKAVERVEAALIAPFKAEHSRYDELEPQIEIILTTSAEAEKAGRRGLIPSNLTERQKLEAAYDMAERLSPRSMSAQNQPGSGQETDLQRGNPAGEKSVRGAPSPGTEPGSRKGQKLDRKASIQAAMAELGM